MTKKKNQKYKEKVLIHYNRIHSYLLFIGITILITHIERKSLDPVFRGLLLKHFFVDKEGNKIIKVGTYEFRYHPNFKLYLSTSVPLFLKGKYNRKGR